MKTVTEPMRQQLAALENAVEGAIQSNLPAPLARMAIHSPTYTNKLQQVEDVIISFMDEETGMVDGSKAAEVLQGMYPGISNWVNLPRKHFLLTDLVNDISHELIGRGII